MVHCTHTFHWDCIKPWLFAKRQGATCPTCKALVIPLKDPLFPQRTISVGGAVQHQRIRTGTVPEHQRSAGTEAVDWHTMLSSEGTAQVVYVNMHSTLSARAVSHQNTAEHAMSHVRHVQESIEELATTDVAHAHREPGISQASSAESLGLGWEGHSRIQGVRHRAANRAANRENQHHTVGVQKRYYAGRYSTSASVYVREEDWRGDSTDTGTASTGIDAYSAAGFATREKKQDTVSVQRCSSARRDTNYASDFVPGQEGHCESADTGTDYAGRDAKSAAEFVREVEGRSDSADDGTDSAIDSYWHTPQLTHSLTAATSGDEGASEGGRASECSMHGGRGSVCRQLSRVGEELSASMEGLNEGELCGACRQPSRLTQVLTASLQRPNEGVTLDAYRQPFRLTQVLRTSRDNHTLGTLGEGARSASHSRTSLTQSTQDTIQGRSIGAYSASDRPLIAPQSTQNESRGGNLTSRSSRHASLGGRFGALASSVRLRESSGEIHNEYRQPSGLTQMLRDRVQRDRVQRVMGFRRLVLAAWR